VSVHRTSFLAVTPYYFNRCPEAAPIGGIALLRPLDSPPEDGYNASVPSVPIVPSDPVVIHREHEEGDEIVMSTLLIVILSVVGFLALVIGGLIVLFFYQGGCCVRRMKAKITKKDYVAPVLKQG
jgi:hypothetical protein